MRITLTGVSGQVGAHLLPQLKAQGHDVVVLDRATLDLTRPHTVADAIAATAPDLVINPAAYTAVDKAESELEVAYAVNAESPRAMAHACAKLDIPLIHFSTDYVFNGDGTRPWQETDTPSPVSVYGASKLAGEKAIAETGCAAIILRTSWVYSRMGKNFLLTMQRLAAEKDALRVVADQHGTPNWAGTLAEAVTHAVSLKAETLKRQAGIYHLSSRGATTWHGFASAIVSAGERKIPVHPLTTAEFPTPAKRPAYSVLDGARFESVFNYGMPTWDVALTECLRTAAPT